MSRPTAPEGFPPLESLALVGDGHSCALIGPTGAIEWYCPTRFDADACVFPILDRRRGGAISIGPAKPTSAALSYVADSAVARASWETSTGRARSTMAMRWPGVRGSQELWWLVEGLAGDVELEVTFAPRPGFGAHCALIEIARTGAQGTVVHACGPPVMTFATAGIVLHEVQGDAAGHVVLHQGAALALRLQVTDTAWASLEPVDVTGARRVLDETIETWRSWVHQLHYRGIARDAVVRSAITLKMLIYEPTGAVVAAPTTSLPEHLGGQRNWDYRYAWLRDAGFTLDVLYRLGARSEADRYALWLCRTIGEPGPPLRSLYGIDHGADLRERTLDELEGYHGSRPVRVGNAASEQLQLDVYGELLDCLAICHVMQNPAVAAEWAHFRALVDFVAGHWREADHGIWEVRDRLRHFVHSKALAWVALERGVRLARQYHLDGDTDWWSTEATALHREVLDAGVCDGRLVRSYGDTELDASVLLLPVVGFLDGSDPLMARTIDAVLAELAPPGSRWHGLLWRYRPTAGDGLAGEEGAFAAASFWLVEALVLAGRRREAEALFRDLVTLGGPLGLFGEEIDPTSGAALGNYPQAFTHIGLIDAALCLDRAGQPPPRGVGCHLRAP